MALSCFDPCGAQVGHLSDVALLMPGIELEKRVHKKTPVKLNLIIE